MKVSPALLFAACLALLLDCDGAAAASLAPIAPASFEQHLGQSVPAQLSFRNEANQSVLLADYFGAQPLVLVFTYYSCSNLCPTVISNLQGRLAAATLSAASRPQILVVSIDPYDSPSLAARKKVQYIERPRADPDQWHFLTGGQTSIAQLAQAAGFEYSYDAPTHQYAHPAGVVLLTPHGKIARYLFGFDYTAEQLASALNDAAAQRTSRPIERVLLICFHYGLLRGPYSAAILAALRGLSLALLLGLCVFTALRLARRRRAQAKLS